MKRITILVVLLCLCISTTYADKSGGASFSCPTTNRYASVSRQYMYSGNYTASTIINSADERHMISACLLWDVFMQNDGVVFTVDDLIECVYYNDSIISSDGTSYVIVNGFFSGKTIYVYYYPKSGTATYSISYVGYADGFNSTYVQSQLQSMGLTSVKNDSSRIQEWFDMLIRESGA